MASESEFFICQNPLSEGKVTEVHEIGLKTVRQSNIERKDGKVLLRKKSMKVQEKCRNSYNNPKLIAEYLHRKSSDSWRSLEIMGKKRPICR